MAANASRLLLIVNILVLLAVVVHDLDHLRQAAHAHYHIPSYLFVANIAAYVPNLLALALSALRSRFASIATIVASLFVIGSFSVVHVVGGFQFWGLWATPYRDLGVDALSWALFAVPLLAAVCAIAVGSSLLLRRQLT